VKYADADLLNGGDWVDAPCGVAMEDCASSHYWGRELSRLGHEVQLIPPSYVRPLVKRQKDDAADAEAICEASQRPTMRFVQIKSARPELRQSFFGPAIGASAHKRQGVIQEPWPLKGILLPMGNGVSPVMRPLITSGIFRN
jgi:hypothetical protein